MAAVVLVLHGWVIGTLVPALPHRLGEQAAQAVRPPLAPLLVRRLGEGSAEPPAPQASPLARPPTKEPGSSAMAEPPAVLSTARPPPPAAARASPAETPMPLNAPTATTAPPPPAPDAGGQRAPVASLPPPGHPDVAPPPVYATRIPAPGQWRYALRYNGRSGEALLTWRHDGSRYQLDLQGRSATQALVMQASQGGFDAAGLAPERFTDQRRGGHLQAANFRRDIGRIAFSGPAVDYPAWAGAQDRLSWLPQLVAILTAGSGTAGPAPHTISLFVVDARGAGALWHFQPEGEVLLPMSPDLRTTRLWRREPPGPEGLRVEAWLDAALGNWPARLRFTALRSGDVFELLPMHEAPAAPAPP